MQQITIISNFRIKHLLKAFIYIYSFLYSMSLIPQSQFVEHVINDNALDAIVVYAADLDNDGDLDAISASRYDKTISWYENYGSEHFQETGTLFSSKYVISDKLSFLLDVLACDMDNDGDQDIVVACGASDSTVVCFENNGFGNFLSSTIISQHNNVRSIFASDVDNDNDQDIIFSEHPGQSGYFENQGNLSFITRRVGEELYESSHDLYATDVDEDGDVDLFYISLFDARIRFFENQLTNNPLVSDSIRFVKKDIPISTHGANSIHAGDLDNDGDFDVLTAFKDLDKVIWHQNYYNDSLNQSLYTFSEEHIISTTALGVYNIATSDINGDGFLDVVCASSESNRIEWFTNNLEVADNQDQLFTHGRAISGNVNSVRSIFIADLDGDEDPDVLSASFIDNKIAWHENMPGLPAAKFITEACQTLDFSAINVSNVYYPHSSIQWNFGDGTTSNEIHGNHQYSDYGEYEVSLTICNNMGCDTLSKMINLVDVNFEPPTEIYACDEIAFEHENIGYTNYTWIFDDGHLSLQAQPSYTYDVPGTYSVTCIATNSNFSDCTFEKSYTIEVLGDQNQSIDIMPNPFSTNCTFSWRNKCGVDTKLTFYDLSGRQIMKINLKEADEYQITNGSFQQGVYFIRFETR